MPGSFRPRRTTPSSSKRRDNSSSSSTDVWSMDALNSATPAPVASRSSLSQSSSSAAVIPAAEENAWERRRRRLAARRSSSEEDSDKDFGEFKASSRKKSIRRKSAALLPPAEEDYDPYDSDPGESYRDHCLKFRGVSTNPACLAVPGFFKKRGRNDETVMTAPPSPLPSETATNDAFTTIAAHQHPLFGGPVPASLPPHLTRVSYSLRSSITDGSDKQLYAMERRELRPNNVQINVSHWSDAGGRPYMEDRYAIENLDAVQVEVSPVAVKSQSQDVEVTYGPRVSRRLTMPLTLVGVFDGHGGDKASQFCADWLTAYIRNDAAYPYDLGYSMKNAFLAMDEDFVGTGQPDGSTACAVALVGGRRLVCANAGDSRAIVVRRDGSIVRLSRDHKPGMPDETRRISALGGRVIYWGRWRVEGLLAVSRSVGDASLKPYITAEPEICEYDVGPDDWFLIVSSDGVWDVMDNEEAAHVVIASSCAMANASSGAANQLLIDTDRFKWAARNLAEHAKSCGSTDNFSVVVVDLKSCGHAAAAQSGRYAPPV
jgi:protein phosphatase 1L